jgi:hypothetical protein
MSKVKIVVRQAVPDQLTWVNERYAEIGFVPSDPSREIIAIAEVSGSRVWL